MKTTKKDPSSLCLVFGAGCPREKLLLGGLIPASLPAVFCFCTEELDARTVRLVRTLHRHPRYEATVQSEGGLAADAIASRVMRTVLDSPSVGLCDPDGFWQRRFLRQNGDFLRRHRFAYLLTPCRVQAKNVSVIAASLVTQEADFSRLLRRISLAAKRGRDLTLLFTWENESAPTEAWRRGFAAFCGGINQMRKNGRIQTCLASSLVPSQTELVGADGKEHVPTDAG